MKNTKLPEQKEEVSFVDYEKLKKEIKRLESGVKRINSDINTQSNKLSDLVKEEIKINAGNDELKANAKIEAEKIIAKAKERESGIIKIETDLKAKIGAAESSKKESDNLIKSNEGKEKILEEKNKSVTEKSAKITKILGLIKDVL